MPASSSAVLIRKVVAIIKRWIAGRTRSILSYPSLAVSQSQIVDAARLSKGVSGRGRSVGPIMIESGSAVPWTTFARLGAGLSPKPKMPASLRRS